MPDLSLPEALLGKPLVVAVSGGADSTALLSLLVDHPHVGPSRLRAAHVNYRLRGSASDRDEVAVRELCRALGVSLWVKRVRPGREGRPSLQDWARQVRYGFFLQVARRERSWGVATAHHLDDQAETVLDRLLRGSGLRGLGALRPLSDLPVGVERLRVWRPLLGFRRKDLVVHLRARGIPWREDASNQGDAYRRNRIRGKLLPLLRVFNPRVEEVLSHLAETASAEDAFLDRLAREAVMDLRPRKVRDALGWDASAFSALDTALQRRVTRRIAEGLNPDARGLSFARLEEARRVFLGHLPGPRDLGAGLSAAREKGRCVLRGPKPRPRPKRA